MKQMFYVLSFAFIVIVIGNVVIIAQTENKNSKEKNMTPPIAKKSSESYEDSRLRSN